MKTFSKAYTWTPLDLTAMEDVSTVEKSLVWADSCSDWEINVSLRYLQPKIIPAFKGGGSTSNMNSFPGMKKKPSLLSSFALTFPDTDHYCVATEEVVGTLELADVKAFRYSALSQLQDGTVILPGSSTGGFKGIAPAASSDLKKTNWRCFGKRYTVGDYIISVGFVNKGSSAAVKPVLEISTTVAIPDTQDVHSCFHFENEVFLRLHAVAMELIPSTGNHTLKCSQIPDVPPEGDSFSGFGIKERALDWVTVVSDAKYLAW